MAFIILSQPHQNVWSAISISSQRRTPLAVGTGPNFWTGPVRSGFGSPWLGTGPVRSGFGTRGSGPVRSGPVLKLQRTGPVRSPVRFWSGQRPITAPCPLSNHCSLSPVQLIKGGVAGDEAFRLYLLGGEGSAVAGHRLARHAEEALDAGACGGDGRGFEGELANEGETLLSLAAEPVGH